MWLVGLLVPEGGRSQQQWYFVLWALVVAVLVAVLVWVTAASARRMPWNAAHVAFSPLLVLVALVSTDLLGVRAGLARAVRVGAAVGAGGGGAARAGRRRPAAMRWSC